MDDAAVPRRRPGEHPLLRLGVLTAALALFVGSCAYGTMRLLDGTVDLFDFSTFADRPNDGRHSRRLPVQVDHRTGLRDLDAVRVRTRAVAPTGGLVVVTVCLGSAPTRGVEACDAVNGSRYFVEGSGGLDVTYRVPRLVRVGGKVHDCAVPAQPCLLVVARDEDFDRSGGVAIRFDPAQPRPARTPPAARPASLHLPGFATPATPVAGAMVEVAATGFVPHEPLAVAWCTARVDQDGVAACEPTAVPLAVGDTVSGEVEDRADGRGRAVLRVRAPRQVTPWGGGRPVSCTARPGACVLAVAAAADLTRSALLPVAVRAA